MCVFLSQALDGDFSDENRERCRVATSPLIQAVENLATFASNPEFASIPAQISNEVRSRRPVALQMPCLWRVTESCFFKEHFLIKITAGSR